MTTTTHSALARLEIALDDADDPTAHDLTRLDAAVLTLAPNAPIDRVAAVRNAVKFAAGECRRIGKLLDDRLIERITETGHDLVLSPTCRLYVGNPPKHDVPDLAAAVDVLLDVGGGDTAVLVRCLSSSAFKVGALRAELDAAGRVEQFGRLVKTTREPTLEEGKPPKRLMESNPTFDR